MLVLPQVVEGVNDTHENLMASIAKGEPEISPSSLYAVACIEEGVAFINGSPQNTFVPGEEEAPALSHHHGYRVFVVGLWPLLAYQ